MTRIACRLTDHRLSVYAFDTLTSDFSGLSDLPIAAHQRGHFLDAFQRERRLTKGLHGDAHQFHRVIIRRHAVGAERTASLAAVYDRPFSTFAHPDGDRLHDAAAVACPVAGFYVHMKAAQAVGAVVAVGAACIFRHTGSAADLAGKCIVTGVGLIVAFFKGFAFVFAVHSGSS